MLINLQSLEELPGFDHLILFLRLRRYLLVMSCHDGTIRLRHSLVPVVLMSGSLAITVKRQTAVNVNVCSCHLRRLFGVRLL